MRIRAAMATALASAGILLAGWQSGAHVADTGSTTTTSLSSSTTNGGAARGSSGSTGTATAATFDGASVQTRFGTVQVRVTIQGGKITEVAALKLTDAERKSAQISSRAAPILRSEVLQAQSAKVQTVSGATVTSDAYLTSLQAALDAAHFQ
ncbi:FMN-binding protein [Paenarthrobacter sp. JL.01a]|uniref:FMN-binding protein n=1 Tax=Paenarthrobacter sp. JL.01a TaxID=2979324 RepID=UPI0021C8400B|nr:FMN-binding protein [Paenarthrobacter sp. JL.01a]UXM91334.1 FMN-binding protein [Paenarthrobacter sp. JL.01a]